MAKPRTRYGNLTERDCVFVQMVDGMGGIESSNYRTFVSLACQAFNVLRRSAGLVLNLLHLMSGMYLL